MGTTCIFLNSACVARAACASYVVTAANGAAGCPLVSNLTGGTCTYVAAATACAERACADTAA